MRLFDVLAALALSLVLALCAAAPVSADAAGSRWIQIEAQPTLQAAESRANAYDLALSDISVYGLPTGWFAIVLGPYSADEALSRWQSLRRDGLIPGDAYVVDGSNFVKRYRPAGGGMAKPDAAARTAPAPKADAATPQPTQGSRLESEMQARRAEEGLSQETRMTVQTALKWAGFYDSAIDGDYGRGTRSAMAAWQTAHAYEATGVLTGAQRDALLSAFRKEKAALGLKTVRDNDAGIEITLPTALVSDTPKYQPPFAQYDAKGGSGVRVLLISEPGDQTALKGLYDLMQTLKTVPVNGAQQFDGRTFTLSGSGDTSKSYTHVELHDGMIKGFTLVWPLSDSTRVERALEVMKESFRSMNDETLEPAMAPLPQSQRQAMLAGLDGRKPAAARTGFYVDGAGTVLTTRAVLKDCARITIGDNHAASVVYRDDTTGLVVLQPQTPLAPLGYARFAGSGPSAPSWVAIAGYSYGGILSAPVLTYGTLQATTGLDGETNLERLTVKTRPGDVGGPVFDTRGAVLGVLLPPDDGGNRTLPKDVAYVAAPSAIAAALKAAGISPTLSERTKQMPPEDIATEGADMAVPVYCWK